MKSTTPVSRFMTENPVVVGPHDTMDEAERLFEAHGIHHLPVVEHGRLVGIVSHTDVLKITRQIFGDAAEVRRNSQIKQSLTAVGLMPKYTSCLSPDDTLADALRLLRGNHFHALPVCEGPDRRLVGIVTTADILRIFEEKLAEDEAPACSFDPSLALAV